MIGTIIGEVPQEFCQKKDIYLSGPKAIMDANAKEILFPRPGITFLRNIYWTMHATQREMMIEVLNANKGLGKRCPHHRTRLHVWKVPGSPYK